MNRMIELTDLAPGDDGVKFWIPIADIRRIESGTQRRSGGKLGKRTALVTTTTDVFWVEETASEIARMVNQQ